MNIEMTEEEIRVALTLMQLGVKGLAGDACDQGMSSYLHLRKKFVESLSPLEENKKNGLES